MNQQQKTSTPVSFWVVAIIALLWNLMGCMAFLVELFAQEMAIAEWSDPQKEWARSIPSWIFGVYAIAVSTGVGGSLGLLLRKRWATVLFTISIIAVVVQMVYTMLIAGGVVVMGPSSLVMPSLVIAMGCWFLWFSMRTAKKGLLT